MRQTACQVVNTITSDSYDFLLNWMVTVRPCTQLRPQHKAFINGFGPMLYIGFGPRWFCWWMPLALTGIDQLAKPTFRSRYAHTQFDIYPFKLETDYNFCNEVKEGVSAIRRFDWSRENILRRLAGSYVSYNRWICILRLCFESFQSG